MTPRSREKSGKLFVKSIVFPGEFVGCHPNNRELLEHIRWIIYFRRLNDPLPRI